MSYKKSPFEQTPKKNVNLTRFDRSHEWKSQIQPGYLIPCLLQETLPGGESWRINSEFMFRFHPMYFPIMHKMTMRADYYYVPNRILWPPEKTGSTISATNPGWKIWITQQVDSVPPLMSAQMAFDPDTWNNNVLGFMGIPLLKDETGVWDKVITGLNAFPLSGYLAIWDEYYRIPQLEAERWFPLTEVAADNTEAFSQAFAEETAPAPGLSYYPCLSAKWQKDYFTSALPQPQLGEAIKIPLLQDDFPITQTVRMSSDGTALPGEAGVGSGAAGVLEVKPSGTDAYIDIDESAASIKQLRIAEILQSFRERIMKVGTRYRDYFKGLWGRDPEPGVVDVPILFGSTFGRVQISDVMSQSFDQIGDFTFAPGDYMGQANMYSNENSVHEYTSKEHGFIFCILQVNPNTSYGQGIHRLWRRDIQTDYALDIFSGIGDQEILKEEVLYNNKTGEVALNQGTFGYIERFAEYKYMNDIHVMQMNFRSGKSQHLGRLWYSTTGFTDDEIISGTDYTDTIEINQQFVNTMAMESVNQPGKIRITDVWRLLPGHSFVTWPNEATIYAHVFHSITADRPLPLYSTPKIGI